MQSLRHLLVGTDFSASADSAIECALTLANAALARITIVHVCELSTELGIPDSVATTALDEELLGKCRERLSRLVARHANRGVEVTGLLRTGLPWEKLGNAAAEVGASLIVIGRVGSGRGLHDEQALGTVAKHVLRRATRPVLTVPPGL
jgi:nucleotide-binding universal stress UspA family protein